MSTLVSTDFGSLDEVLVLCRVKGDTWEGHQIRYWCEGCGYAHQIGVHREGELPYGGGPSWNWNGDMVLPVLSPSQLCRTTRYPKDNPTLEAEYDAIYASKENVFERLAAHPQFRHVCHTFIGINGAPPGHMIFLSDCWTKGAPMSVCGQVRKLLPRREWPNAWWAKRADKLDPGDPA